VCEQIEEEKDTMTFNSDEELIDEEKNEVLHTMIKDNVDYKYKGLVQC
jgi:hypothetical protein